MNKILAREDLKSNIHLFEIEAPAVARKALAGQFVILRIDEFGERIPLTIADYDRQKGTVSVVFMQVGKTTRKLATLQVGDSLANFAGPLGLPTEAEKVGTVVCVGGGFGNATIYPIARAMREGGNHVITIMGFRTKDLVFWEDKMRSVSDELLMTTDDGSHGGKGVITVPLKELLDSGRRIDLVIAIGPGIMMKFVSKTTEPYKVKTIASLNPIMMDGTGLCGACRVSVGGVTKFACVDGPDFDAHAVDWDELLSRQRQYLTEEKEALERWMCESCKEDARKEEALKAGARG